MKIHKQVKVPVTMLLMRKSCAIEQTIHDLRINFDLLGYVSLNLVIMNPNLIVMAFQQNIETILRLR